MSIYAGASTQGGSNHSDEVSAVIEPRVTESREEWRARMEAKRTYKPTLVSSSSGIAAPVSAAIPAAPAVVAAPRPAPPRTPTPATSPDTRLKATVITAYLAGDPVLEIAKRYHRGTKLLREWIAEAGIEPRARSYRRPAGHSMTHHHPLPTPEPADLPVVHAEPVSASNVAATYDCAACDFHIIDTTDDVDAFNEAVDDHDLTHLLNVAANASITSALPDAIAFRVESLEDGLTTAAFPAPAQLPTDDTLTLALAAAGAGVQSFIDAMAALTEAASGVMTVRMLIANEQVAALRADADRLLVMLGEGRPS